MPPLRPLAPSMLVLALLAAPCLAPAARADDAESAALFRRAEVEETTFGRLEQAASLFREAAKAAAGGAARARAELRAGACLLRLGRTAEGRALLDPLAVAEKDVPDEVRRAAKAELERASITAPEPPAPATPVPVERKLLEQTERERDELRAQFDAELKHTQGLEKQVTDLAQKLRQMDEKIRTMSEKLAPSSPEEVMRQRMEEREGRLRAERELSRNYTSYARRLHQEGDFAKARDFLYVAVEKDAENEEAKALLKLVAAPLGDRERLYEELRGVLALADEVRAARTAAEIETLVAEASRRQERGEFAASVAPLESALALVDTGTAYLHEPAASKERILSLLTAAKARGASRSPVAPQPRDDADSRGLAAVRELLASAGSEVVRGMDLRIHDIDSALGAAALGLPPAPLGDAPVGWTISTQGTAAAPLLAEYLRAADAEAFTAPGATIDSVRSALTAVCDSAAQARLADRIARMADVTAPAAELRISAHRMAPGDLDAILDRRQIHASALGAGVRAAAVPAADLEAIAPDLASRAEVWPSVAALRASPLRLFRMTAGSSAASLALDVLPVTKPAPGAGLRVTCEWTPGGRQDGARLTQTATAGGVLGPGAALVVFGLADPADPSRDLAVFLRMGAEAPASGQPSPPQPAPGQSSSELLLPSQLRGLTETGPVPGVGVPGHPVPTRDQAIAARLRAVARTATLVEVKEGRVRVVGPDDARDAVRRFLDQVDVVRGLQSFDVRVHQIAANQETEILRAAPKFSSGASGAFSWAILRGEERRTVVDRLLPGAGGRVVMLQSRVAAPPTGRADMTRILTSGYLRDLDVAPGPDLTWGRSQSALADEGLVLAIRPFGRTGTGRVDFDLSLRAAWIADRGERLRRTPLGEVTSLDPSFATWWGDLSVALSDEESLVLIGMRSPLAAGGERDRLAVVVSNAPPR